MPSGYPLLATEITPALNLLKPTRAQQFGDGVGLLPAVLKQQPTVRLQVVRRQLHEPANIIQTVSATDQRTARFKAHIALLQMRVIGSNVGRVGDNQIKLPAGQRTEPVALLKGCIANLQALGITARQRHLDALAAAANCLTQGAEQLALHAAGELLAEDLRDAQNQLSEITGEFTPDDLLGRIFSSFCIGK